MNVLAEDIWRRLVSRTNLRSGWGNGVTRWVLLGNEKEFGELHVEFGNQEYDFDIYIHDKNLLEMEIQKAIDNHNDFNNAGLARLDEHNSRFRRSYA